MKLRYFMPLILSGVALGQTPSNIPPKPNTPPQVKIPAPPPQVAPQQPAPALTELESVKLQLELTQVTLLNTQMEQLRQSHQATVNAINAAHPGFVFNEQTGILQALPAKPESTGPNK